MNRAWKIGLLLGGLVMGGASGGVARAQTCAPSQAACPGGACCATGLCCPTAVGGCCGEEMPYCCQNGTCAVTPSACGEASTTTGGVCGGYDVPCGDGCIPAGADCCDSNHYCPPTTICASPSVTMCTNLTTAPPTQAYLVTHSDVSSPLGAPPNATARSCAIGGGRLAAGDPCALAAMGVLVLALARRKPDEAKTRA